MQRTPSQKGRAVRQALREVFNTDISTVAIDERGMRFVILVESWIFIKEDLYDRWAIAFREPPPGYRHLKCIRNLTGQEQACEGMGDAVLKAAEYLAHLRGHLALECVREICPAAAVACEMMRAFPMVEAN